MWWEVQDERQITNYVVYHDMIMLGLIHTHPQMTSFLSSVDLHALWDYAKDNQSLVSIVLAPEKKTPPAYCLTKLGLSLENARKLVSTSTNGVMNNYTRKLIM